MEARTETEKLYAPFIRVKDALIEWAAHCVVVFGILTGIWLVEKYFHILWPPHGRILFDRIPLSYIFDGADLLLLLGFLGYGGYCVVKAYIGGGK